MPRQSKQNTQREADKVIAMQRVQIVDEYGQLDSELAPTRSKQRRFEDLGRVIKSWHAEADAESSVSSAGKQFEVVLGPCSMQTRITDIAAVYQALGHEAFLKCASLTLKAFDQSGADPAAIAALTVKERTGTRTVVIRSLKKS